MQFTAVLWLTVYMNIKAIDLISTDFRPELYTEFENATYREVQVGEDYRTLRCLFI